MGIPRFLRRMKDAGHGRIETIGSTENPKTNAKAIIDGPSLAHHIYKTLISNRSHTETAAIGNLITYSDCARATLRWLEELQQIGYEIEAIFFDGALPETKREIRIERLVNYAGELHTYKSLHDITSRANQRSKAKPGGFGWTSSELRTARRSLPPIPFLVPAIVEALVESPYRPRVYVVPGEADAFCVAAAIECNNLNDTTEVSIFTNDSDLVVFDAGARTTIAMLNELRRTHTSSEIQLSGLVIKSSELASHCGVADLVQLAYQMAKDPHESMKAIAQAMEPSELAEDNAYLRFAQSYSVDGERAFLSSILHDTQQQAIDAKLDARLSEVIFQSQCHRSTISTQEVHAFLPFLIEDPSRASAWHIGARIRELTYSTILQAFNRPTMLVIEFQRSGHRIAGTESSIASSEELRHESSQLVESLTQAITPPQMDKSSVLSWKLAALSVLFDGLKDATTLPSTDDFVVATMSATRPSASWSISHLAAQYAAAFYSLRMWHQALRYLSAEPCSRLDRFTPDVRQALSRLRDRLSEIPSLTAFFDVEENTYGNGIMREFVTARLLALQPDLPDDQPSIRKKRRKRHLRTDATQSAGESNKKSREAENKRGLIDQTSAAIQQLTTSQTITLSAPDAIDRPAEFKTAFFPNHLHRQVVSTGAGRLIGWLFGRLSCLLLQENIEDDLHDAIRAAFIAAQGIPTSKMGDVGALTSTTNPGSNSTAKHHDSAIDIISRPLTLPCGLTLSNRLVKCPMQETLASPPSFDPPVEQFERLYTRWAESQYGLLITGQVQIDRRFLSIPGDTCVHPDSLTPAVKEKWTRWAHIAQRYGTPCIVQIAHPGRMSPAGAGDRPADMPALCPSSVPVKLGDTWLDKLALDKLLGTPKEMTVEEIDECVENFVRGAEVARDAGFAGCQIHGAHGFLVSQFLSPHTNRRSDAYGGTPDKRMAFLRRLVEEIRAKCPPPYCLAVKLNSGDYMAEGGLQQDEALDQVRWLVTCGKVDFVEISGGNAENATSKLHNSFANKSVSTAPKMRASTRMREAYFTEFAERVQALHAGVPIQLSGGFRSRTGMADAIDSGICDLVGLGRAAVLEPELPRAILLNPARDDDGALAMPHQIRGLWFARLIPAKVVGSGLPVQFFYYNMRRLGRGLTSAPHVSLPTVFFSGLWNDLTTAVGRTLRGLVSSRAVAVAEGR